MKRVRVENYVEAPVEARPNSSALFDGAASCAAGHPSLVCFAPGAVPEPEVLKRLKLDIRQDGSTGSVRLFATDDSGEQWVSDMSPSSEYMCAVVDKRSGTARIVEVAGEYCLSRNVKPAASVISVEAATDSQAPERSYREKRGDLLQVFGGKRAKDRQAKLERNTITGARVSSAAASKLDTAIDAHKETIANAPSDFGTYGSVAPPHNSAAERVEEAYPLLGLFTAEEFTYLMSLAKKTLSGARESVNMSDLINPGWNKFCWSLMCQALAIKKDQELSTDKGDESGEDLDKKICERLMAAMYLHYLISLVACPSRRIGRRERLSLKTEMDVPEEILDQILLRFTDRKEGGEDGDRFRTEEPSAKLLYYAVVLWLTATGFSARSGANVLADAFKVAVDVLIIHVVHIGGVAKKNKGPDAVSSKYRVELRAPLKFPQMKKRGRSIRR